MKNPLDTVFESNTELLIQPSRPALSIIEQALLLMNVELSMFNPKYE